MCVLCTQKHISVEKHAYSLDLEGTDGSCLRNWNPYLPNRSLVSGFRHPEINGIRKKVLKYIDKCVMLPRGHSLVIIK